MVTLRRTGWSSSVGVMLALAAVLVVPATTDSYEDMLGVTWPCIGLACLLVLEAPRRLTVALSVLVGALAACGLALTSTPTALSVATGVGFALACLLLRRALQPTDERPFVVRDLGELMRLFRWGTLGALVSAVPVALTMAPFHTADSVFDVTAARVLGSFSALVLVVPLRAAWHRDRSPIAPARWGVGEQWLQRIGLAATLLVVFGLKPPAALLLVIALPLVWAASRAGRVEVLVQTLAVGALSLVSGRFGRNPASQALILGVQYTDIILIFLVIVVVVAVVVLPLHFAVEDKTAAVGQAEQQAALLRNVLDASTGVAMIAMDARGLVTVANSLAATLTGRTEQQLLGRSAMELLPPGLVTELSARGGLGPDLVDFSSDHAIQQGDVAYVFSFRVEPLGDPTAPDCGWLLIATDVSERTKAEQALSQALAREQESSRLLLAADSLKDDLISTISHELRTPITSIVGYVEMLEDGFGGSLSEGQADMVGRVARNADRLQSLVDDLLLLDSFERGEIELKPASVDLGDLAAVAAAGARARAERLGLTVRHEIPAGRLAIAVRADPIKLRRAVDALLDNALKFTPPGGRITLRVDASETDRPRIEVVDTGMGIAEPDREKVFGRFYRTEQAGHHAIQGSGLGLTLVRAIVEAHGGTIVLEETPGGGTTACLRLGALLLPHQRSLGQAGRRPPVGPDPSDPAEVIAS